MKKFNSTFIFLAILVLFTTVSNAQYKLNIGNFWVYSTDYQEYKISVIDTATFFDSILYFEVYREVIDLLKSTDTISSQYYIRKKNNDFYEHLTINHNTNDTVITEDVFYKYNAQLGDKWIYRIDIDNIDSTDVDTLWAEVVDVFDGFVFGEWRTVKKITYWTGLTDFSKYFSDDFGELSEENYLGVVSELQGCYIDSIAYGDTSFTPVSVQNTETNIYNYSLEQNYPNPFNPSTLISYSIPKSGNVEIVVFDILGKNIITLINKYQRNGIYKIIFEPTSKGINLTSGIYFYRLISDNFIQTKKMIYLR